MSRKTVSIKNLVEYVNNFNATTANQFKDERIGKNDMLERILMNANAYNGFAYLKAHELSETVMSVGIREQRKDGTWNFDDTDHSRVRYFYYN